MTNIMTIVEKRFNEQGSNVAIFKKVATIAVIFNSALMFTHISTPSGKFALFVKNV